MTRKKCLVYNSYDSKEMWDIQWSLLNGNVGMYGNSNCDFINRNVGYKPKTNDLKEIGGL